MLAALVSAAVFVVNLITMGPGLAPYRDTGELSLAAWTLGVAHPTSYPLYVLGGHLFQLLPLGDPGYRLALLSCAAAAAAAGLAFGLCRKRWGLLPAAGAALLLGLGPGYRALAQVQEMYSLWTAAAVLLMGLAWRSHDRYEERAWLALCFIFGVALTNRLDLLLWAPGLLWLALSRPESPAPAWAGLALLAFPAALWLTGSNFLILPLLAGTLWFLGPREGRWAWLARSAAFGLLGLSCYLYLPLRSLRAPLLDWNHPADLSNFAESLLRTRYGGTLDLLSKSYARGENFDENLVLYARHLWRCFSLPGLLAVVAGAALCARTQPRRFLGMLACWLWSGPLFLLLANMPPNPHAAVIVEPHYLLSDLVLVLWAAEGLAPLSALPRWAQAVAAVALGAGLFSGGRFETNMRRWHLYDYDYARNVMRCAPLGATIVAKKDVQLYSLWHHQGVLGLRPDLKLVSQGLAGSPWYQAGLRRAHPGFFIGPLRDAEQWKRLVAADAPVLATPDAEVPDEVYAAGRPRALLAALSPLPPAPWLWELLVRRGRFSYEGAPDFFASDLIDSHAQAAQREGAFLGKSGPSPEAARLLMRAWSWHWVFPEPVVFLGYLAFQSGDLAGARGYYETAVEVYARMLALGAEYRALPEVMAALRRGSADAWSQLGAIRERLKDPKGAEECYARSLALQPTARARYNLAVLYWGRDWDRVVSELEEAVRLEPGNPQTTGYLEAARRKRGR